ncbi:MAG: hypothetical protein MSC31_17085 [Solirubrobacteraceae bacterium MAG38_C4-C5]|nr:hypothetical protein [Candidatus Siliceabacter maunaloa]
MPLVPLGHRTAEHFEGGLLHTTIASSATRSFFAAAVASALIGAIGAAPAQAANSFDRPEGWVSSNESFEDFAPHDDAKLGTFSGGGLQSYSLQRYQVSTQSGHVTIRGQRSRYMVGLARNQWGFDAAHIDGRTTSTWFWGHVNGSSDNPVNKCVWLQAELLNRASTPPQRDCSSVQDLAPTGYMSSFNGNVDGVNCFTRDGRRTCDGTDVRIDPARCPNGVAAYTNVQPWSSNAARSAVAYRIPAGAYVKWRYITKDGRHTAVRYAGSRPFAQDWAFIDTGCISNYRGQYPPSSA